MDGARHRGARSRRLCALPLGFLVWLGVGLLPSSSLLWLQPLQTAGPRGTVHASSGIGLVARGAAKKKAAKKAAKKSAKKSAKKAETPPPVVEEQAEAPELEAGDEEDDPPDLADEEDNGLGDEDEEDGFGDEDGFPEPGSSGPRRRQGYTRIQDEEILPPGTRYQGGRYGLQFFVGDLVEVMRDGALQYARVARIPTDERPMDGSFIVKWDSDGEEWKCAYKDLNKPRRPDGVPFPDWIEDWWPAEPPMPLAEELELEWTWVSDLRPGGKGGGMVPESPDQGVYSQNKDDPYRPRPGQVLYGVTC